VIRACASWSSTSIACFDVVQAVTTIAGRFVEIAARFPQRLAVSVPGNQWTYAELDARSSAFARRILAFGGNPADPVALFMDHGAPLIAAILGVLKAGRMYVALDPCDAAPRLAAVLADSGAALLITDQPDSRAAAAFATASLRIVGIEEMEAGNDTTALPEVPPAANAWLMYTSGSTGKPKGVWQNHPGVLHHAAIYGEMIGINPDDRVSLVTSCSLASSTSAFFVALLNGAALCPFHLRSQGTERLAAWMNEQKITIFHSVPTVFRRLARAGGRRCLETTRLVRLGGEAVLGDDAELFRRTAPADCRLLQSLSSTETGIIAALFVDRDTPLSTGRLPVGRPIPGLEVVLVDAEGRPVANGGEGRITVRGTHLRGGYWRNPELTARMFGTDPDDPRRRIFFSNDLARWREGGLLEHLGRADRVVKIRGLRADLDEVEAMLRATGAFEDAAVVALNAPAEETRLVAFVTGANLPAAAELRREWLRSVPEHLVPGEVVRLEQLPQTPGGKIDRAALARAVPPKNPERRRGAPPRDGFERKVAAIWESVLKTRGVSRDDDFFELGGTSLQSAEILARVEQTFNIALPPATLLERGTVAQLAELLAEQTIKTGARSLVPIRTGGSGRPLFLVHNGKGDLSSYGQLARRISDRPIYGFQSAGLAGESWPLTTIRRMAQRYVEQMITINPGPYLIAGTCMGGLVAFEMAAQLRQRGKSVAFVGLIDSAAPPYSGRRAHWHERYLDPLRDGLRIARWTLLRATGLARNTRRMPAYRKFVASLNGRARRNYRPGFFPGTITLFLTTDETHFKEDRRRLMSRSADDTRVVSVPGNRRELFHPPMVDTLARELNALLVRAETAAYAATPEEPDHAEESAAERAETV
jgi:amino acid adenylation domain-containing protein